MTHANSNTLRNLCPALQNKHYFNYGGQGPLPTPSLEAMTTSWQRIQELGPFTTDVWPYISAETNKTRASLSRMCGVAPHRLALTENVTSGCVLPLWGLPLKAGDRLLIGDCEHPGVVAACHELARREQLEVDNLPVQQFRQGREAQHETDAGVLQALEDSLRPRTKVVVLSHLLWNTGQLMPIPEVADHLRQHAQQPFLLVDAAQSMGQIPVEAAAQAADIYAFTGHKWICGPEGLGGVALSERILNEASPTLIGWRSLRDETRADINDPEPFHHDSRRFEIATSCVPLMAGLRQSLRLFANEGHEQERLQTIQSLSGELWRQLKELSGATPLLKGEPPAGLVSFQLNDASGRSPDEVVKILGSKGIWIRNLEEPICLRACTHITTKPNEISRLVDALEQRMSPDH
ncbi:cysteine lyase [Synechococcus sp. WH 8020]|uniref:aminotransferase class V-fold PLP-dependent enzyme n=1 Tax=Synechococcus sp. (strain WH8020) TaxID=32052 RepID=UPI00065277B6|nr:aminotransferase class V-fold PLP-dependent enzyme [Synechococcus sp. WH 8020]AKN59844.1 cysteine lyase [Synechococcus sp. WH 8020]